MTVVADTAMPVAVGDSPGCGSGFPHHHQYCHPPPPPFAFSPPNGHLGHSHCRVPFNAPALHPFDLIHQTSPVDLMGSSLFGQSWPPSASFVPIHPPTPSTFAATPNFDAFANCDQTRVQLPSRPPALPFAHLALHLESQELPPPMFPFQFHHPDNLPNLGNYCRFCGPPPPPPVELIFPPALGHPHYCQILRGPLPPPPPHCGRTCGPSPPSPPPFGLPWNPRGFSHGPHQIPRDACVHPPSCSICEPPIPFFHLHHHPSDDETKNCPFHAGPAPIFDSNSTPPRNDGGIKVDGFFSLHHLNHGPSPALPFGLPPPFGGFQGPQFYHRGDAINVNGIGPCHHTGDCQILHGPPLPFGGFRGPQFYHHGKAINVGGVSPCHHTGDCQILRGPPLPSWPPFGLPQLACKFSHGPPEISRNPHHLGVHSPMNSCPICEPPIPYSDLHHHPSDDESKNRPLHTSAPVFGSANGTPPRCDGGINSDGFAGSAQFDHHGPPPFGPPPPPPFGGFRGPHFYHPCGHLINHVKGMDPCHHHQVAPNGSTTPMSSGLSDVKNKRQRE